MKYNINEIFDSIQGEGINTGLPVTFIRLQGCSVACTWCDTKVSWDSKKGELLTLEAIIEQVNMPRVVITGGEPLEQDIMPLTLALQDKGIQIFLETSGTCEVKGVFDWVTVSPKFFNKPLVESALFRADELKFVYTDDTDNQQILEITEKYGEKKLILVSPNGKNKKATRLAVEFCMKHNFRLSVQMHKYINIR